MVESLRNERLRKAHGRAIAQTLDTPVMVLEYWELNDIYTALASLMIFGLILSKWPLTLVMLLISMFVVPAVRNNREKGFIYHIPYRWLGVSFKGLPNPQNKTKFSQ